MSKIYRKNADKTCKTIGDHKKYLTRITKTLYYGKLPNNEQLSLPVTELAAELFSEAQKGKSLERLHCNNAAKISRNACVSPCSLVLAMLYLERLKKCNPEYLDKTAPSDIFLVSLMVSCKFLYDDGESDEVFIDEWAASGGITVKDLIQMEKDFLKAIDWEIYVSELTFWKKLTELESTLAIKQGGSRGFFTYTELQNLAVTIELYNLIHCLVAVSVILAATYTAGLLTIAGSIYITSQVPGTSLHVRKITENQPNAMLQTYDKNIQKEDMNFTEEIKADLNTRCSYRNINLVLKTSLLLASIKATGSSNESSYNYEYADIDKKNDNAQYISWDYWNVPIMDWLAKTSGFASNLSVLEPINYLPYFLETSNSNSKTIEREDQIHKATKTRIQDQMESSWHEEWTDTIKHERFGRGFSHATFAISNHRFG